MRQNSVGGADEDGGGKRFYLQYTFPPSSVGETGRTGFVGRREVGHGSLAERALSPIIPSEVKCLTVRSILSITGLEQDVHFLHG